MTFKADYLSFLLEEESVVMKQNYERLYMMTPEEVIEILKEKS